MKKKSIIAILILVILFASIGLICFLVKNNNKQVEPTTTSQSKTSVFSTTIEPGTTESSIAEDNTSTTKKVSSTTTKKITSTSTKTTKKNSSTKTTKKSTANVTTTVKKTVVDTKTEVSENVIEEKYGSKLLEVITKTYDVYSDGTVGNTKTTTKKKFDTSGFNGTYSSMKSEASSLVNSNNSSLQSVFNHVNEYRSELNVVPVSFDKELSVLATVRALEIGWADKFSHTRPDGRDCFSIFSDSGYRYTTAGENIASGYSNADSVSEGWKNSSGHYKNMVDSSFTKIGVGYAKVNGKKYWVQLFAG